jgi:hypothetical protein
MTQLAVGVKSVILQTSHDRICAKHAECPAGASSLPLRRMVYLFDFRSAVAISATSSSGSMLTRKTNCGRIISKPEKGGTHRREGRCRQHRGV